MVDHNDFSQKMGELTQRSQELDEKYGEQIKELLAEVGYAFIGERRQVCKEASHKEMKRFKMFYDISTYAVNLWYGTSRLIPCEDTNFAEEDEFWWYEEDTGGKEVLITIGFEPDIENPKKFSIDLRIDEKLDVLPKQYANYQSWLSSVDDLFVMLNDIKDALLKHPYSPDNTIGN